MSDKTLSTSGYLLYSQIGEDFCEIGTLESIEPIDWDKEYGYETEKQLIILKQIKNILEIK